MGNSKKILVIVAIVVAVCVGYLFLFFQPVRVEIDDLERTLQKKKADMLEKQRIAKDVDKFDRMVEELNERLNESLARLPNEKEIPEILRLLSKLAGISGIEMIEFKVLPEARKTLYSEIPIEMQLKGGFHNIAIFFDKIGKQDRIINISNVKIASPTKETGETIVTTSCTATAFRFLPIAQQPPAQ